MLGQVNFNYKYFIAALIITLVLMLYGLAALSQTEKKRAGVFTIKANNVSPKNMYIQSATLNGKPLNVPRFKQKDMVPRYFNL